MATKKLPIEVLNKIVSRAHYLANQMIFQANHRKDKAKGDPKVGGHSSASSSAIHIMGTLHLLCKTGFDHISNKPHASPADHSYNYLLDLLFKEEGVKLSEEEKNMAMASLRAFQTESNPHVFQSYHSAYDPDYHNFFPTGTVGIPQVNAGYLALAYRFAKNHGHDVPEAHFWALMGDSEFREGSVFEATPDFAEREIGNLTWIVDYNRQSLDGHRITNKNIMGGTDDVRIENTMRANGWEVIQVRHGQIRQKLFQAESGDLFKTFLEEELDDYDLQTLLLISDPESLLKRMKARFKQLSGFLKNISASELFDGMRDFGGHDFNELYKAMEQSKKSTRQPTIIVAHTLKGWGLEMAAKQGNHSSIPNKKEMDLLQEKQGLPADQLFSGFAASSAEGKFLTQRGTEIQKQMEAQYSLRDKNKKKYLEKAQNLGRPESMDINLKMASYPHTQWMLGQCTAKLTRIANTSDGKDKKPLTDSEKPWKLAGEMLTTMAPDVGTSTNLNPAMDGKIFGAPIVEDLESEVGVKDKKLPDLIPGEENSDRFVRFEIVEANTMSCMGSYGKLRETLGIPILPLMTVYDFFIKRAHDQFFYNLYWKSSFILVGTPSGVTLSPEGAQHGWKSDFQIPNQITWEPAFCVELDWILSDAIQRHLNFDNDGRSGVVIRGVTRGIDQKLLLKNLKKQKRFKTETSSLLCLDDYPLDGATLESEVATTADTEILNQLKSDVLAGAYYLVDYRGYANYEPGDNVVHIFAMGSLVNEALEASNALLERGIYANVIVVTSSDLLVGNLAHDNSYDWLKSGLQISGEIVLQPLPNGNATPGEVRTLSGQRVPIVSVHDGEPGLLDNLGSIVGTRQESLAVRKHSKCGRPKDIYGYHKIDSAAIIEACGKVLSESAMESIQLSQRVLQQSDQKDLPSVGHWKQLWDKD